MHCTACFKACITALMLLNITKTRNDLLSNRCLGLAALSDIIRHADFTHPTAKGWWTSHTNINRQPHIVKIIVAQENSPAHWDRLSWWLILRYSPPSSTSPRRERYDNDFDSQKRRHRSDHQLVCEPARRHVLQPSAVVGHRSRSVIRTQSCESRKPPPHHVTLAHNRGVTSAE